MQHLYPLMCMLCQLQVNCTWNVFCANLDVTNPRRPVCVLLFRERYDTALSLSLSALLPFMLPIYNNAHAPYFKHTLSPYLPYWYLLVLFVVLSFHEVHKIYTKWEGRFCLSTF
jgi:hypothetical protein